MFLTPPQSQILETGLLSSGFSCVLQLPTGSGKTWLAEHAIRQTVREGHRAIYVAATRALAEELYARWLQWELDKTIGIFTGDYSGGGRSYPVSFTDAAVLIVTPERLDACTRNWRSHWDWIPEVNLVVVDEIHLLGEGLRGARLEGALSRLRRLKFIEPSGRSRRSITYDCRSRKNRARNSQIRNQPQPEI